MQKNLCSLEFTVNDQMCQKWTEKCSIAAQTRHQVCSQSTASSSQTLMA